MKKCYCSNKKIEPVCTEVNGITVVVIPAQLGGSGEGELYAPQTCRYKNTVVKYLADGYVYIYDKVGNWTLIADSNAIEPTIDEVLDPNSKNPIANFAVTRAINDLTQSLVSLDESLATVAKSGNYNDLTNKPVIDTELDKTSNNAVTNAAIATAIETITTEIDRPVLYDLEMTADANSVTFTEDKIDVVTGETTQETDVIPSASETTAGTISASEYNSIKSSQEKLNALEGGSVAITGLPASPTQAQLTTAWLTETGESALINRASIYDITNTKVWTYYTNTTTWYEVTAGTIQVNPFTNSVAGTILGSTTDGNVSANLDGTGTVSGWASLVNTVSGKADSSSLATVATTGDYSDLLNTPTVDSALSTSSTNAVENQAIATEFEDVAYIGTNMGTISNTAFVGSANIQTDAVTTVKIADLNVTTDKIASNAITTAKIADGAVTLAKIESTTLFTSQAGQGLGAFVLSDAIENYTKLEIEYADNS